MAEGRGGATGRGGCGGGDEMFRPAMLELKLGLLGEVGDLARSDITGVGQRNQRLHRKRGLSWG